MVEEGHIDPTLPCQKGRQAASVLPQQLLIPLIPRLPARLCLEALDGVGFVDFRAERAFTSAGWKMCR